MTLRTKLGLFLVVVDVAHIVIGVLDLTVRLRRRQVSGVGEHFPRPTPAATIPGRLTTPSDGCGD